MTPTVSVTDIISLLRVNISSRLKRDFVDKDQVIDLMVISAMAREHLLLIGPPGTAKSELVKRFVLLLGARQDAERSDLFEYLLTRFTEPNEIFGPVNIKEFQSGTFTRNIQRALPQARIAFLDEVFKANSAILNALLTILNERFFFNGLEQVRVPLISVYGAANEVPESDELSALFDRFLLRVRTDNVDERHFPMLFDRGWRMEQDRIDADRQDEQQVRESPLLPSLDVLDMVYYELKQVDLSPVRPVYTELVRQIRADGISLSDRRAVKLLKLVAASALLRNEQQATPADLWVLLHVWNRPEQIAALQAIVGPVVEQAGGRAAHAERPLEELADSLTGLEQRCTQPDDGLIHTPAYHGALLHELEALRRDVRQHSAARGKDNAAQQQHDLLERVETLIDTTLDRLESGE